MLSSDAPVPNGQHANGAVLVVPAQDASQLPAAGESAVIAVTFRSDNDETPRQANDGGSSGAARTTDAVESAGVAIADEAELPMPYDWVDPPRGCVRCCGCLLRCAGRHP